jgi:hypothetical protein
MQEGERWIAVGGFGELYGWSSSPGRPQHEPEIEVSYYRSGPRSSAQSQIGEIVIRR